MAEPEAARPLEMPATEEYLRPPATRQEVLDTFSQQELEEALRRRNAEAASGEEGFQAGIEDFFNPEVTIDVASQLAIVSDFWIKMGYEVPILGRGQSQLEETLKAHPGRRVVPAPLLSFGERTAMVENARSLPGRNPIDAADPAFSLQTPGTWHDAYGQLLRDPQGIAQEGYIKPSRHALRYKTPSDEMVSRKVYEGALLEGGQAVEGTEDTIWTFPVMDVGRENTGEQDGQGNRVATRAESLFDSIEPTATPESLLTVQVLRRLGAEPREDFTVTETPEGVEAKPKDITTDFANEFIYRVGRRGDIKKLAQMVSVVWDPARRQLSGKAWFKEIAWKHFGVRDTVSGISFYD